MPMRWPRSALNELCVRPKGNVAALDGLRAFAVFLVVAYHWWQKWLESAKLEHNWLSAIPFYWGWSGVDLFFVLSGLLIGKQLWRELDSSGGIDVGGFVIRRGLRIWPLYFATLLFLLFSSQRYSPMWPDWLMLSNYFRTRYERSWSLSSEEQFYLLMPLLLIALKRFVPQRWWWRSLVIIIASVGFLRFAELQLLTHQGFSSEKISILMYFPFHLHCEPLFVGFLISWVVVYRGSWLSVKSGTKPNMEAILIAFLLVVAGIVLRAASREIFAYLALGSVFGGFVVLALADNSFITSPLRWPIWYPFARLSFGMYLNHLTLSDITDQTLKSVLRHFGDNSPAAFLVGLVAVILQSALFAMLTFIFIENPGLAFRESLLKRRHAISRTLPRPSPR